MATYTIKQVQTLKAGLEVDSLFIEAYPWYRSGLKQWTSVKAFILDSKLYLYVVAEDIHSSAKALIDNTAVYEDSCFEFFVIPSDHRQGGYINFEFNCIGTRYIAYNRDDGFVKEASEEQLGQVVVKTSLDYKVEKVVSREDSQWSLVIEIPLSLLDALYPGEMNMDKWLGNFYRCGGEIDPQYAMWHPMKDIKPNYHLPEQFGELVIK